MDVFWHDGMLKHTPTAGAFDTLDSGAGLLEVVEQHPENVDRVRNIKSILERGPISKYIKWHQGRQATIPELHLFHTPEYVEELVEASQAESKVFCNGTCFNPGSWESVLLAVGSTIEAMQHILYAKSKLAYALVRPPGQLRADGYCFLNNAGLAIESAIHSGKVERAAIIDIDVHYGNGSAAGFYTRDDVLTVSLHMNHGSWGESHPQTGQPDEAGKGQGKGFNVNIPLPNGTGDRGYVRAMETLVLPRLDKFKPEIIVVTMGLDSSAFDPNGRQYLTMSGYRALGRMLRVRADTHSDGRMLVVQEGGYNISYTAYCVHAFLEGVLNLDKPLLDDPIAYYPEDDSFVVRKLEEIQPALNQAGCI